MTLHDFILVLRSRWRVVTISTLLAFFVVTVVNLALPKQYRASATVVVDTKGGDPVAGSSSQNSVIPGYLATQVGIVGSDRVVQKVIKALALASDERVHAMWRKEAQGVEVPGISGVITQIGEYLGNLITEHDPVPHQGNNVQGVDTFESWLTARLTRKLQVRPAREGNLIEITMTWEDAARAAQIANAFARAYIDTNLELKVEPAKEYVKWFEERNTALRKDLEQAKARLSEYQRSKGVLASSGASLDIENARLSELSSQVTALQGSRADSASRERQAGSRSDSMTEVLQNPVVASLKSDLSRLELKRAETAERYGDNYPDIRRLDEQISTARSRLDQETGRVAASLTASNQINARREIDIRGQLEAQRRHVLQMTRQRDEISVLQSDVTNAQRAYDNVTQRLAQTSLESQNQMTNVAIITPAVQPLFRTARESRSTCCWHWCSVFCSVWHWPCSGNALTSACMALITCDGSLVLRCSACSDSRVWH